MTANAVRAKWEKWIPNWTMNTVTDEIEHKLARSIKRRKEKEKYLNGVITIKTSRFYRQISTDCDSRNEENWYPCILNHCTRDFRIRMVSP